MEPFNYNLSPSDSRSTENRWAGLGDVLQPFLQAMISQQQGRSTGQQQRTDDDTIIVKLSYGHAPDSKIAFQRMDDTSIKLFLRQQKWLAFPHDQKTAIQADPPTMDWKVCVINGEGLVVAFFTSDQLKEKVGNTYLLTIRSLYQCYYDDSAREKKTPLHLRVEAYELERDELEMLDLDSD